MRKGSTFKTAAISVILIGMLVTLTPVGAKGKTLVSFAFVEYLTPVGMKMADGNTMLDMTSGLPPGLPDEFAGDLSGIGFGVVSLIIHKDGSFDLHHVETFTGTMEDGKSGTIVFNFVGKGVMVGIPPVSGTWAILSGTGDFATLHGEGTFERPAGASSPEVTITGNIHFAP